MAIRKVFQGHWRALEIAWLSQFVTLQNKTTIAVVTAGQSLAEHLMRKVNNDVIGAQFLPGFPALAKVLTISPLGPSVTKPQQIALACLAGYKPESAEAASDFFERLIDMGVYADMFDVIACSTKNLHEEVLNTSKIFTRYFSLRKQLLPGNPHSLFEKGPENPQRYKTYIFYGFYDLNPGQRKYLKDLSKTADILWFSPVHPSHFWRETSQRTMTFLNELGFDSTHRVDGNYPLSNLAQFAENLLTNKTCANTENIELLLSGSGTGFSKAVIDKISALRQKYKSNDIAIISTGDDTVKLLEQLYLASIPVAAPLTVKASDLPLGNLMIGLLKLDHNRFHHKNIEKLLLTGCITMKDTPDATAYALSASKTGARFGLTALRITGYPFAEVLTVYFEELPENSNPQYYLKSLISLLNTLTDNCIPSIFTEKVLSKNLFVSHDTVSFPVFSQMLKVALDYSIDLSPGSKDGIFILSPEKARGIQKKAIVITGLEEGNFPRPPVNDPRLPIEVKKQLQLPSPETREIEQAFLLRQLFEAAQETVSIICRTSDSSGKPVTISPFLASLLEKSSPLKPITVSDSPEYTLSIPQNPAFLNSSSLCQKQRFLFDPENPSQNAVYSGMIGPGLFPFNKISATALESYAYDPFSFLLEKIWDISDLEKFPVRSDPDPRTRGNIVHKCVEAVLKQQTSPADVVRDICKEHNLSANLGSDVLLEIWMNHLVKGIESLVSNLEKKGWSFQFSEKKLNGTIAGFEAGGRIDLIFTDINGKYILADLKTGKPKTITAGNLLKKNLFQLPFYRNLALQNGFSNISEVTYIYMESNGTITFKSLTNMELQDLNPEFENRVIEIVESIRNGIFPETNKSGKL